MTTKNVPLSFVKKISAPTWSQAHYGLRHFLLSYVDVIELAQEAVVEGDERPEVIEIAGLTTRRHDEIWKPLQRMASEPTDHDLAFWYRTLVSWIWETVHIDDVLFEISALYNDYGRPDELKPLIYYADLHEDGVTEATLLKRVEMYVENLRQ